MNYKDFKAFLCVEVDGQFYVHCAQREHVNNIEQVKATQFLVCDDCKIYLFHEEVESEGQSEEEAQKIAEKLRGYTHIKALYHMPEGSVDPSLLPRRLT